MKDTIYIFKKILYFSTEGNLENAINDAGAVLILYRTYSL